MEKSVWRRKINVFLLFIPLVLASERFHLDRVVEPFFTDLGVPQGITVLIFAMSALALIPLAGFIESAVEELAELLGPFVGGMLHTTASNIAECAIALSVLLTFAASQGAEIVVTSIAGVVVRNALLFLGLATLLGCLRNGRMRFSAENAGEYSTILALAVTGLSLPTLANLLLQARAGSAAHSAAAEPMHLLVLDRVPLSLVVAILGLLSYLAYIAHVVFHVGAHRRPAAGVAARATVPVAAGVAEAELLPLPAQPDTEALFAEERESATARLEATAPRPYARSRLADERKRAREERGERRFLEGHRGLRGLLAVVILALATAGVVTMSEGFAGSIEHLLAANVELARYEFFLGLILIPVLAGVVELYGSTGMARRNRMEITMAVTAGASIQLILLVTPVIVIVGALTGHPVDLVFKPLEIIIFVATTFTFMLLSRDGEATILEGVQLCALWLLLAVTALFLPPI